MVVRYKGKMVHLVFKLESGSPGFRLPTEVEWKSPLEQYALSLLRIQQNYKLVVNNAAGRSQGVGLLRSND